MIIEQIDDKRLMIMLEENDMNSLELTYDKVSWKNQKFKLLIAKLLALAKFKTGFSVDNCKLSIETMPQGSGCVIIFTLFPELKIKSDKSASEMYSSNDVNPYIYKIDNSNNLLDVCDKVSQIRGSGIRSSTVFEIDNKYFILIYPKNKSLPGNISVLLSEYGEKLKFNKTSEAYLYELGKVLHSKNAISYIGKCFR